MQFLQQDCRATLREGLDELYRNAPDMMRDTYLMVWCD